MSRGGRRGTRKLREARPEDTPPKPRVNAKTKLCRYNSTGKCVNGALCNFAHGNMELQSLVSMPGQPSWASVCEASEVDNLSTCPSDGEGNSLITGPGLSRLSTETEEGQAAFAEEGDMCIGSVYAPARFWQGCPAVTVKNTFLQFGVTSYDPRCASRRALSAN